MPRFFRAEDSDEQVLVISEGSKPIVYFSPDGKTFQALKTTHFATVQGRRTLTLQTPNLSAPPVQLTFINSWQIAIRAPGSKEKFFQYTEKASILNVTLLPV